MSDPFIYDAQPEDGHAEIEAWEVADLALKVQGMDEDQRRDFWAMFQTPEQKEVDELMRSIMLAEGCDEERAWRIIHTLNGVDV